MLATLDQVSGKSFDYVIIGGGTTGLVVAARLSEDSSVSVLVLEAGASNLNDPAIHPYTWAGTPSPRNTYHCGHSFQYSGKTLGGSSSINFFQFHLPSATDIDAFEKLGNKGWNWETLKRYYTKVEKFLYPQVKDDIMRFDVREHGFAGDVSRTLKRINPSHVTQVTGVWLSPLTISPKTRTRSYSANMYYEPHASRNNLIVLTSAHVAKISLSRGAGGEATAEGVSFLHEGKEYRVFVRKEVIILELSGIGNADVLRKAGVEVFVDLPGVGNNVQEHYNSSVKEELESEYLTVDCLNDPDKLQKQTELYHAGEKGVFDTKPALMAYAALSVISPDAQTLQAKYLASIQARIDAGDYPPGLQKQYKLQLEHIKAQVPSHEIILHPSTPDPTRKYACLMSMSNNPFSRGSIHIKSSNPLEYPAIDPHYFEEEYDIRSLAESVKFTRRLAQQEPFKRILTDPFVSSLDEERFPGPAVQTDEEILEFLRDDVKTTFHTVGSCSMLPHEDGGVVDNKLKVYGTTNIRVMDISIVPLHFAAHTQATAYAIGEFGADIIRGRVHF
ncbi:alcohol oxidase [Russula earlei]|uniref:Alcohol oxidase n=1 Tax=Russula earlei TaxID=71964 RepID=A0ACC0U8Y0_9AGAM|nr:alcohol oxidase [Russula earlei]